MWQDQSAASQACEKAIRQDQDLSKVRKLMEIQGFPVDGDPGGDQFEVPLMCCQLVSGSKAMHIARYLHSKGAKGYDMGAAVEVGDLERLREIVARKGTDFKSNEKARRQGCAAIKRCSYSENGAMAKYLFEQLGPGTAEAEEAYNLSVAMHLRDTERMDAIAATDGFDINRTELVGSILSDTRLAYNGDKAAWDKAETEFIEKHRRASLRKGKYLQLDFALKSATITCNVDNLSWVLDQGADANSPFDYDNEETAITFSLSKGSNPEVVECLLKHGVSPPWLVSNEAAVITLNNAMHRCNPHAKDNDAEGISMVRYLLREHAASFMLALHGTGDGSPLHTACGRGDPDLVRLLLESGAVVAGAGSDTLMTEVISSSRYSRGVSVTEELISLLHEHGCKVEPAAFVCRLNFDERDSGNGGDACLPLLKHLHSLGIDITAAARESDTKVEAQNCQNI